MDDKTAEIPSLKNFTAQTKKQNKAAVKSSSQSSAQRTRRPSGDTLSRQKNSRRKSQPADARRRETGNRAERTKSTSAPAPRTYARQRQDVSEAIARTQVVNTKGVTPKSSALDTESNEFSSQPLYRQRSSQSHQRTQRTSQSTVSRTSRQEVSSRPKQSSRNSAPQSGGKSLKKQKRPLSPRARKFRKAVINTGLCFCVIVIGVVLSLTVLFKTESITVSGNGNIPKNDIIASSGLNLGENIFTAPKGRAEERLEKIYPYIQQAEVKSVFPNSINIEITMADPACIVEGLGGFYIVSSEGKVLEVAATADEMEAPVIEGVNVGGKVAGDFVEFGTTVVGEALKEMFTAFSDLGAEKITAINVSAEDETVELKYVYDNRIVVYLGIPEHITYKVRTAHTIIKEKIDTGGTMIAGDLDVSMCHDSMKSYFNQYTLLAPNSAFATEHEPTASEETQPETQAYYY